MEQRQITPVEALGDNIESGAAPDTHVQFPGFVYDKARGIFIQEGQEAPLTPSQNYIMASLVENPNEIYHPSVQSNAYRAHAVELRTKMRIPRDASLKLLEGYSNGLRLNFPPLQRDMPGYIKCSDFSFTMNGFIDLGEEFVPLTPQELAILKALYSEPYEPIGDLSLLDRLGSNAQLSILKVLVGELNKKIVGGREGIRSPIRRTKEVGYCFEDPLFRIDRNKPSAHSVPRLEPRIQAIEKRAVEANVNAEKEEGEHAHWWLIDEAEGHMSEGICKKCGDRQLFVNTPEYIVNRDEKY